MCDNELPGVAGCNLSGGGIARWGIADADCVGASSETGPTSVVVVNDEAPPNLKLAILSSTGPWSSMAVPRLRASHSCLMRAAADSSSNGCGSLGAIRASCSSSSWLRSLLGSKPAWRSAASRLALETGIGTAC